MIKRRGVILVLVLLALFLLILNFGRGVMEGCYYYPESDFLCGFISEDVVVDDCALYPDCDISQYFSPGQDCSEIDKCQEVFCTATCEYETKGECERLGGLEIDEVTIFSADWCGEGCCDTGEFCNYIGGGGTKWECVSRALQQGLDKEDISWITKAVDPEMTGDKCINEICLREILPAALKVCVLREGGILIDGAEIEIGEKKYLTAGGCVDNIELKPGTHLVKASANGFISVSQSISLGIDETLEFNFTLAEAIGIAELSGVVVKDAIIREGIPDATVSWKGATEGYVLTGADGSYTAAGLVLNEEYTFTVSKYGYMTVEKPITLIEAEKTEDFILEEIILQGVEGEVWIDGNDDGTKDYKVYGANIYVDGIFRGYSQYEPLGYYEVSLGVGEHEIYATYLDFELREKIKFTIAEGGRETQDLVLTRYIGECSVDGETPNKEVEIFLANHVPGEKKIQLEWTKPCAEVIGYEIQKHKGEEAVEGWPKTFSPIDFSHLDLEVEWGETYTYEIAAIYSGDRQSKPAREVTITLGDKECEEKYSGELGAFTSFCLIGTGNRQRVWTCTDGNELISAEDCSGYAPGVEYCAQVSETRAICKDTSGCEWYVQEADPFGLYYERQSCYGTEDPLTKDLANYCYFDYTETIVDKCGSCVEIGSCFDYKSEDACDINNCLGTKCRWLDSASNKQSIDYSLIFPDLNWPGLVTKETGHGYCVEEDYKRDDKCGLCGPEAELFENYYCTAEICSGLGECFSKADLSICLFCGDSPTDDNNCYAYGTEFECTGGQPLEINYLGEVILSKDSCGWGRCRWDNPEGAGTCVKDGDGDVISDCESLPYGQTNCKRDSQAPQTKVVPEGVNVISHANPKLTFHGKDEKNHLAVLGYCAASAESNVPLCGGNDFQETAYLGNSKEDRVEVDLVEVLGDRIEGQTYRLRYYSKDEYSNQESVKETFIFVDTELPEFTIEYMHETIADTTNLKVYLTGLNELMSCDFELKSILPLGETLRRTVGREERDKEVLFEGLNGVIYDLAVSCEDDYGNENNDSENFVFDLERRTILIHPMGAVKTQSISFEAETLAGASCELFSMEGKTADFVSDEEGKHHKTNPIPGFNAGIYSGTHYVICEELLTQEVYNPDYFDFMVDFTGPDTQIVLQEGIREIHPSGSGWEEIFVDSAAVSFECNDEGFGCDKTYYCLTGEDYATKNNPCYEEFTESLTLSNGTNICYYSLDLGGNEGYPVCGKILIDGYGITLVNPRHYWYEGGAWGISNIPVFDWEIMTKIPTQECKFDWIAEFDYENIPLYRVLSPMDIENHYLFEDFPGDVISAYAGNGGVKTLYVKCKDLEGTVGPAKKLNLEYDPTAPEILDAYAEPDPVYEGIETTIHAETDDKTLCRYDEGEAEYGTMEYSFPGEDIDNLRIEHKDVFVINFNGASRTYNLTAQCKNGAGNLSEAELFNFFVDYSAAGNIMSIEPSGYLRSTSATLRVLTNKNALCNYDDGFFEVTGGTEHTQQLTGLSEGEHIYLVQCRIGEYEREWQIKFTVDLTPPAITEVDDGNISCSLSETPNVFVSTDEEAIVGYYYELYDEGNATSSIDVLVDNGTINAEIPFKIDFDLIESNTYYLKVKAKDAAGNWGALKESNGFLAVPSSYDICVNDMDTPEITFVIDDSSCTEVLVEMYYNDDTGCDVFDYGKSFVSSSCEAVEGYNGQQILFEKTGWICYYAADEMGNEKAGIKKIDFHDNDGDGIVDNCDQCPNTDAGAAVDEEGCASGQVSDEEKGIDTDGDGLPDYWEKLYDEIGCELDYADDDSDFDGVYDTDEDYDEDSYDNYDEFMAGYDPCVADALPGEIEEIGEVEVVERLPEVEEVSVLAWVLFILGLLMVLGGCGYLVYYYKFASKPAVPARPAIPRALMPIAVKPKVSLDEKLLVLRKAREKKTKAREREKLFEAFGKRSREIPHVEEAIKKGGPPLKRVSELARKHAEVKRMVKPGLRHGERGIFARLESIAKKTKEKRIEEVVSKGEAKNIFDKLKSISKKRKGMEK